MKLLALISGGKDGVYSILCARRLGHEVVLLGHLSPKDSSTHEADSYMFQTIGHNVVKSVSECLGIPLLDRTILGKRHEGHRAAQALPTPPILFRTSRMNVTRWRTCTGWRGRPWYLSTLSRVQKLNGEIEGILTGAIASKYQLERVKNV